MPIALDDLPFEILNHVVEHFDNVQTVINFSQISRRFHAYAQLDGFRVFILRHHQSYQKSGSWSDAVRSLTALSRAWTRKAFLARNLRPPAADPVIRLPKDHEARPLQAHGPGRSRQSMGYQPVIDCVETWHSGSSHETLVWGAGAELVLRSKSELPWKASCESAETRPDVLPLHGQVQWITYRPPYISDGRDDITGLRLLRPNQHVDDGQHHMILGRASGYLEHITIDKSGAQSHQLGSTETSINCLDVTTTSDPIVAACVDDFKVVLHQLYSWDAGDILSGFALPNDKHNHKIWTMRYLNSTVLSIGRGPTKRPLSLLSLTPAGLVDLNFPEVAYNVSDAIYAIEPLQDSAHLFLTGHYSGHVQLNDMRIPNGRAAVYDDPVDNSPIYSLLPMTGPRFVAGGARHCLLKFFDMRRPNWSCSSYTTDTNNSSQIGYNIFLPTVGTRMTRTSPTYSLAASSPHASSFYAGIENGIVQMDMHSPNDPHAQPSGGIPLLDRASPTQAQLEQESESLRLVEHSTDGAPVLLRQTPLRHQVQYKQRMASNYDDRWAEDFGYDSYQSLRGMAQGRPPPNSVTARRRVS